MTTTRTETIEGSVPATPFNDPHDFVAIPRISALRLAPDGGRLVAAVSEPASDGKSFVTALWQMDPAGRTPSRRLTYSGAGEADPAFLPDGSLLFTSRRRAPDGERGEYSGDPARGSGEPAALWLLPAGGGEARRVASAPGGVSRHAVARDAGTVAFTAPVMPDAADTADDERRRRAREDAGVTAILHGGHPVRHWDHDLGPAQQRLFAADPPAGDGELAGVRDLTPEPGRALDERSFALTPDGAVVVTGWLVSDGPVERRAEVVAIDTRSGRRDTLAGDPDHEYDAPQVSPDGRHVVCVRERRATYDTPYDQTLWLVNLDGSGGRDLTPDLDLWPTAPVWAPDGSAVYFVADENGRRPIFKVGVGPDGAAGPVARVTEDAGAYSDVALAPDGRHLYALRDSVDEPPTPVRLPLDGSRDGPGDRAGAAEAAPLPAPGLPVDVPGSLTEVGATSGDGRPLRAWLVLPDGASPSAPAPLLLWIHGGPYGTWNGWHWRWNPWIMAARGYAVLLPDPALSTGYGQRHIECAWGDWGGHPYTDLMTITTEAERRPDIDATRTAAMGGSFGGYMANWIAVNTDRFAAIVTHASLWALDQMFATTDEASFGLREFGDPQHRPQRYEDNSPHRRADRLGTPMLVIHGDRDYRVPIGEALRLWWDLSRRGVEAKFLYYPDENHWVLTPGNAAVWYETVLAFLAHHVLGEEWKRPELL